MNSWASLDTSVDVSEVEFPVQVQEDRVITHIGSDVLSLGPGRGLEILIGQLGEAVLVQVVDLEHVALLDHVLEVLEELLDLLWDSVVKTVLDRVSGMAVARVFILVVIIVRIHLDTIQVSTFKEIKLCNWGNLNTLKEEKLE